MPSANFDDIGRADQYGVSAHRAEDITPHDSTEFDQCDAIYVGGAGNATVLMANGSVRTFPSLLAGNIYPISIRRVNSTSLTASNLIALYYG